MTDRTTPAQSVTQHTPGPWRQEFAQSLLVLANRPEGERIVAGVWGHSDEALAEGYANARLIAAAPDLLAALESALRHSGTGHHANCPAGGMDSNICSDLCWSMYRAIVKATGEAAS